jgi:hypothetical protein
LDDVLEFEGEYLGGHPKLSPNYLIKLQIEKENLIVAGKHLLSIPYAEKSSVKNFPHKEFSTLAKVLLFLGAVFVVVFFANILLFVVIGLLALGLIGLFYRRNKPQLNLTFKDELDMEQTVVFKMKKPEETLRAIYDRVVEAKKKRLGK